MLKKMKKEKFNDDIFVQYSLFATRDFQNTEAIVRYSH